MKVHGGMQALSPQKLTGDVTRVLGMRTFDWTLFELYNDGDISYEEAIRKEELNKQKEKRRLLEEKQLAEPQALKDQREQQKTA